MASPTRGTAPPVTAAPPSGSAPLHRDPWLRLNLLVLVASAGFYMLPIAPEAKAYWGEWYGYLPVLTAAILGVVVGIRRLPDLRARRFWALIAVALACHLAVRLYYLVPASVTPLPWAPVADVLYGCFYLAIIVALHYRPDRPVTAAEAPLRRVETVATTVFVGGLLVYFVVIPGVVSESAYGPWVPSMLYYITLDALMLFTLLHLATTTPSPAWRRAFGLLAGAAVIWVCTDTLEASVYLGESTWMGSDSPLNAVWYVPAFLMVAAARLHRHGVSTPASEPASGSGSGGPYRYPGSIAAYAIAVPALHLVIGLTDLLDPETHTARDVTVLTMLALLLGLVLLHQRLLAAATERLRQVGEHLRRQRDLLAAGIDEADEAVALADERGMLIYANQAWYDAVGDAGRDGAARVPTVLASLAPEAGEAWGVAIAAGATTRSLTRKTTNGQRLNEVLSITRVPGEDGADSHLLVILRDVTRQTALEQQLQRARRMESLGTMAGGIAHDFNNMLTGILGHADLLRSELPSDDPAREGLDEIVRGAMRARSLTSQILTFSRQQTGRVELVDLSALVDETVRLMRPTLAPAVHVDVDLSALEEVGTTVWGEPGQLHQVLLNLLRNALDAVGAAGRVRVSLETDVLREDALPSGAVGDVAPGRHLVLTVADDGPGMSAETVELMYDPFYTTREVGKGTGLGLSVVHGIVAGLGGEIAVRSAPGDGATFHVYLPLRDEQRGPSCLGTLGRPVGRHRALLVTGSPEVAATVASALGPPAWRVTRTDDPEGALDRFLRAPLAFDLALVDASLDALAGPELAARLHRVRPSLPVVLIADEALENDIPGVAAVVGRPPDPDELSRALDRIGGVAGGARRDEVPEPHRA